MYQFNKSNSPQSITTTQSKQNSLFKKLNLFSVHKFFKMQFKVNFLTFLCQAALVGTVLLSSTNATSIARSLHFEDNEITQNQIGETPAEPTTAQQPTFTFPENLKDQTDGTDQMNKDSEIQVGSEVEAQDDELKGVQNAYPDTEGRTIHHIANKINFIESGIQSAIHKFFSIFFKTDHPPADYVDYIYRKDGGAPKIQVASLLKPLINIPQYLTRHPINFKRLLPQRRHSIAKRSTADNSDEDEILITSDKAVEGRSGRTLYKIIPNFEQNFNKLFRAVFPAQASYASQPNSQYENKMYEADETSKSPSSQNNNQGQIAFTNLMRMLPEFFNRRIAAAQTNQERPQDLISTTLRRIMDRLRRPIISLQPQRQY